MLDLLGTVHQHLFSLYRKVFPRGLFGRLRTQMMLLLLLGLLTVDVVAYLSVRSLQYREVSLTLTEASARITALPPNLEPVLVGVLDALSPSDLYVAFIGTDNQVLTSSDPVSTSDVPVLSELSLNEPLQRQAPGGTRFRMVRVSVPQHIKVRVDEGGQTAEVASVVIGYPLAAKQAALSRLLMIEIICALVVLAGWYLLSTGFISSGLRPLRRIARTAEAIAEGKTTERVEVDQEDPVLRSLSRSLNEAFDARQESEDRMRDFVADASHELRTPLTSVRGWADLYRERGIQDWDGVDTAMGHIWQEARRMDLLVEDMLVLARLDSTPKPALAVAVALKDFLGEVVADAALLHPQHIYDLRPAPQSVLADPAPLRRAVSNLLVNAGRHTPAGSTVTISALSAGEWVEIRIEDDGPGLSLEERQAAFRRFWRSDRSRGRPGGTGLGLSISRSITRAVGGDLRLERSAAGGLAAIVQLRPEASE